MAKVTFFEADYINDVKDFAIETEANITFEEGEEENSYVLSAPTRQELFEFLCEWEVECGGPSVDEEEVMESIED